MPLHVLSLQVVRLLPDLKFPPMPDRVKHSLRRALYCHLKRKDLASVCRSRAVETGGAASFRASQPLKKDKVASVCMS